MYVGGKEGFLKEVMRELSLKKEVEIYQMGERNRWASQAGRVACAKAQKHKGFIGNH